MLLILFRILGFFLVPAGAWAGPSPDSLDRGKLSLAWDARESGLCEEALIYLAEISIGSPVGNEAIRLRADCLRDLGRYAEAADLLEDERVNQLPGRRESLLEVYSDWAWDLSQQERYREAESLAGRGLSALPGNAEIEAIGAVAAFRLALSQARVLTVRSGKLRTGEEFAVRGLKDRPEGNGWVRAYPWQGETPWIPDSTLEEWMPTLAARLKDKGKSLWVRLPGEAMRRAVKAEARKRRLELRQAAGGLLVTLRGEEAFWDEAEWNLRAAAEGLGVRGAAIAGVAQLNRELELRSEMVRWVQEHRGRLEVRREGQVLRLRDPTHGRSYDLDPAVWAPVHHLQSQEWDAFWSDLVGELGRQAGAYRCFCGRPAALRETLIAADTSAQEPAAVLERGRGYALVLLALCPLHQQYVTSDLLKQWGVTVQEAWARAKAEALKRPWELTFDRGEQDGLSYLVLGGEGVSSLIRRPDLLLNALEAIEGRRVRGTAVTVWAPTVSSLVIAGPDAPAGAARAAAARVLLQEERRGGSVERVGYRAFVRLPNEGAGSFQVRPLE